MHDKMKLSSLLLAGTLACSAAIRPATHFAPYAQHVPTNVVFDTSLDDVDKDIIISSLARDRHAEPLVMFEIRDTLTMPVDSTIDELVRNSSSYFREPFTIVYRKGPLYMQMQELCGGAASALNSTVVGYNGHGVNYKVPLAFISFPNMHFENADQQWLRMALREIALHELQHPKIYIHSLAPEIMNGTYNPIDPATKNGYTPADLDILVHNAQQDVAIDCRLSNKDREAIDLITLGNDYFFHEQHRQALRTYQKALKMAENPIVINEIRRAIHYMVVGN
jgi:hypothetical protein